MSHLAVTLNGKYLNLKPDTAIDLSDVNPYFNERAESMSHTFNVPLEGNREQLGNVEVVESDARLIHVEGSVMGIESDGILLRTGKTGTIEDQELRDEASLQMVGAVYSLDEYLDGVRCRDVELKDKIQIGETIGNIKASINCNINLNLTCEEGVPGMRGTRFPTLSYKSVESINETVELGMVLPAVGFSRPDISNNDGSETTEPTIRQSFINTDKAYPEKPYCNARICYIHHASEPDDKSIDGKKSSDNLDMSDDNSEFGKYNPYLVLDANRPASGICFYVLYFLDCLFARFKQDGIAYDNSNIAAVPDLCRLAFFTTQCKYDMEPKYNHFLQDFLSIDEINKWLKEHHIGSELILDDSKKKVTVEKIIIDGKTYVKDGESPHKVEQGVSILREIAYNVKYIRKTNITASIMNMYANSQNFPDAEAQEILDSLWGSFGIRFHLDQQTRVVKPVFIRDIFRDNSAPIDFPCEVLDAVKCTERTTGFRMQYSGQSDRQQREDNITLGIRDYDTTYDYQDYRNLDVSKSYTEIIMQAYDTNMTCYVDFETGNVYRVKVDSEAESRKEYKPNIFEVRQLNGVEIGDCSKENEDYIEEVTSSFQPVVFNDINYKYERKSAAPEIIDADDDDGNVHQVGIVSTDPTQILSAFVSDEMWHENLTRELVYPLGNGHIELNLKARSKTVESYDVSSSDDGDSPLQSIDWGLAVAIMRGGGSSTSIDYYDYDYDMFGNCKYRRLAGNQYTMSLDSIDCYSQQYDYNGDASGIGNEDRISLKIRSYIEAPYDVIGPDGNIIPKGTPLCNPAVKNRGLFDKFFSEYAHFVLNRKKVKLSIMCEPSALVGIQWTKRYRFGDYVGWINKINTHITAQNGIEKCEVELFIL